MSKSTKPSKALVKTAVMQSAIASELRLGNLIQFSSGTVYPVDIIYNDYCMLKNWFYIPFTKEWFDKLETQLIVLPFEYSYSQTTNRLFIYIGDFTYQCSFIHQFQNLYFSLVECELAVT
jgi:hypothetical protein